MALFCHQDISTLHPCWINTELDDDVSSWQRVPGGSWMVQDILLLCGYSVESFRWYAYLYFVVLWQHMMYPLHELQIGYMMKVYPVYQTRVLPPALR